MSSKHSFSVDPLFIDGLESYLWPRSCSAALFVFSTSSSFFFQNFFGTVMTIRLVLKFFGTPFFLKRMDVLTQKALPLFWRSRNFWGTRWGTWPNSTVGTVCYDFWKKCKKTKTKWGTLCFGQIHFLDRPMHSAPTCCCQKPPMVRACRKKEHKGSEPKHLDSKRSSEFSMSSFSKIKKMMNSKTTEKSYDGLDRRVIFEQQKHAQTYEKRWALTKRRTLSTSKKFLGLFEELLIIERTRPSESKVLAVPTKIVENIEKWFYAYLRGKTIVK